MHELLLLLLPPVLPLLPLPLLLLLLLLSLALAVGRLQPPWSGTIMAAWKAVKGRAHSSAWRSSSELKWNMGARGMPAKERDAGDVSLLLLRRSEGPSNYFWFCIQMCGMEVERWGATGVRAHHKTEDGRHSVGPDQKF